jgi:hypothetical protein
MRYAVVIEEADSNHSACVLDLPGCVATGETVAAVEQEIHFSPGRLMESLTALGQDVEIKPTRKARGMEAR